MAVLAIYNINGVYYNNIKFIIKLILFIIILLYKL